MNQFYKNLSLWLVIGLIFFALFNVFEKPVPKEKEIMYSDFMGLVDTGQIIEVTIQGEHLIGKLLNGKRYYTNAPSDPNLVQNLRDKNVRIESMPKDEGSWFLNALISWFPMLLLLGVWIFFMRQMQGGGNKALSFGKSRAQVLDKEKNKITFKDVAGIDEAREEVEEITDFLRDPSKYVKLGGKIPKGVLLTGPPGTGKTLLAKAIAGEANVPFFSMSGSDFVEMFVGVGASRVRDLFEQGKKNAPCIIFIDEIDAVGRHRGAGMGGGHDEREQTLNQLLVEMDGFETNEGLIIIASTNRSDVLDPALTRPGRFDRHIFVDRPDIKGREAILRVHTQKVKLCNDVTLNTIARGTPGFTGADLANLVNEAALIAARREKVRVEMVDFEDAKDKVMMGLERRSILLSDEEKRNTAYHEAGHALIAALLPGTDPVHKVTIIPRGRALGLTMQLPEEDKHSYSDKYMNNNLAILLGGRIAEEVALDTMTTGAGNDLERVTATAKKMVCQWGMSKKMGSMHYGKNDAPVFVGREMGQHDNDYSEKTAQQIDEEVRRLVDDAYKLATKLMKENYDLLEAIAETLLKEETLDADDIKAICNKEDLEVYWKKKKARERRNERQRIIARAKSEEEDQKQRAKEAGKQKSEPHERPVTPFDSIKDVFNNFKDTYQNQKKDFEEQEFKAKNEDDTAKKNENKEAQHEEEHHEEKEVNRKLKNKKNSKDEE
ncbi:MAG: ATP-dependent zinc metalloprotease FtsH [Nitrospinae bacterium]|nr:ATP-dependent zinc metalloprotease FtsH [Nitrospinota bacterium]